MSLPTSITQTPVDITHRPDYGERVRLEIAFKTEIATGRSGKEQRIGLRSVPKLALSYSYTHNAPSLLAARVAAARGELAATVRVPVWTDAETVTAVAGKRITVASTITHRKFRIGYPVFIRVGTTQRFATVTAKGTNWIEIEESGAEGGFNVTQLETVQPFIMGNVQEVFRPNAAAGLYQVRYLEGALQMDGNGVWHVGKFTVESAQGWQVLHSGPLDSNARSRIMFPLDGSFASQAAAETALANRTVAFEHTGGAISIRLLDVLYSDNVAGLPSPRFRLEQLVPTGSAPPAITAGSLIYPCIHGQRAENRFIIVQTGPQGGRETIAVEDL